MIFFFFSSRRRHTRYWRDWSSDVCSSDLEVRDRWPAVQNVQRPGLAHPRGAPARETPPAKGAPVAAPAPVVGGTDQADGPPPPAEGRVRARRDRGGASRS